MNERKYLKNVLQRLCDDNPKMQQFSKLKILPHIFQLWEIFIKLVEKNEGKLAQQKRQIDSPSIRV